MAHFEPQCSDLATNAPMFLIDIRLLPRSVLLQLLLLNVLTVRPSVMQGAPRTFEGEAYQEFSMTCQATGLPPPKYRFYKVSFIAFNPVIRPSVPAYVAFVDYAPNE